MPRVPARVVAVRTAFEELVQDVLDNELWNLTLSGSRA
jgi:hypothetical protein